MARVATDNLAATASLLGATGTLTEDCRVTPKELDSIGKHMGCAARVDAILDIIDANRRTEKSQSNDWVQRAHWGSKISALIEAGATIEFVMPAFPCKSPNTDTKVLGTLPDAAEERALKNLGAMVEAVDRVSPGGARVVILADGYTFGDIIRVPDKTIAVYLEELKKFIPNNGLFKVVTLSDMFPQCADLDGARRELSDTYGPKLADIRERIEKDPATNAIYCGMKRFLAEDIGPTLRHQNPGMGNTALQRACGEAASEMLVRYEAFHHAVRAAFPDCVRCSVHPQEDHKAEKIGIALVNREDGWGTPWHGVLVTPADPHGPGRIMKKQMALQMGFAEVHSIVTQRPWRFVAQEAKVSI